MNTPRKTPAKTPGKSRRAVATPSSVRKDALADPKDQTEEGIQVAIRMRPLNANEGKRSRVWKVLPKYSSVTQTTAEGLPLPERVTGRTFFTFDKTFPEDTNTQTVYDSVAKGIVSSVVTGLNGTIFAYGQTSSGKTFTMQGSGTIAEGTVAGGGGIVHMAAADIFRHISSTPDRIFLVRASFLEIYNEEVRDLLSEDNRTLPIREDPRRGVFVKSQEEIVTDFNSLLDILFRGEKSRAFAATAMNERSSRSHTIFRVTIESRKKEDDKNETVDEENTVNQSRDDDGAVLISTLNLVDLAGSESVRHTGATGDRQKEGGMINQSLLTLSRVIVALGASNQTHINFRDSKLTRILQPSLSGNARMAVVCCATPSELYLEETRSTLQFASRAKLVKTRAQINEIMDDRSIIRKLQRELALAKRQVGQGGSVPSEHVRALEHRAATAGSAAREAEERLKRLQASILNNTAFLGDSSSGHQISRKPRKRRLSEGNLLINETSTPSKENEKSSPPLTVPRPTKQARAENIKPLSSSAELSLLKEALQVKSQFLSSTEIKVDDALRLAKAKESELVAALCSNDVLRSERDTNREEATELSRRLADLRSELATHESSLLEKDEKIAKALRKLEDELRDRAVLEETVDGLQSDKMALEQRLGQESNSHQQTCEMFTQEIAKMQESIDNLTAQSDLDKAEIARCLEDGQKAAVVHGSQQDRLLHALTRAGIERDQLCSQLSACLLQRRELDMRVNDLSARLEDSEKARVEAETTTKDIETALAVTTKERDEAIVGWESSKVQLEDTSSQKSVLEESLNVSNIQIQRQQEQLSQLSSKETEMQEESSELKANLDHQSSLLKHVTEELKEMGNQNSSLQAELQQAEEESDALRKELQSAKTSWHDEQRSVENLKMAATILESEVAHSKEEIRGLVDEQSRAQSAISSLQSQLEHLNKANSELEIRVTHGDAAQQKLVQVTTRASELEAQVEELRRVIETHEDEATRSRAHVSKLHRQVEANNSSISVLHSQVATGEVAKEELLKSKKREEDLHSQVDILTSELHCHQEELARSSDLISTLQRQIEASNVKVEGLQSMVASGQDVEKKMTELATKLQSELAETKTSLQSREKEIAAAESLANGLEQRLEEQHSLVGNLQVEVQAGNEAKEKLADLVAHVEKVGLELMELEGRLHRSEETSAEAASLITELKGQLKEQSSAFEQETAKVASLVSDLKQELEERNTQIENLQSEVEAGNHAKEKLVEFTANVEKLELELREVKSSLQRSVESGATAAALVKELEGQLEERASIIKDLRLKAESAEEAKKGLAEMTNHSDELKGQITHLTDEASQKSEEIAKLQTELEKRSKTIAELETLVKSGHIALQDLSEMSHHVNNLESQLSCLTKDIQAKGEEGTKSSALIDDLQQQLEEKRCEIQDIQLKLDSAEVAAVEQSECVATLESQLSGLRSEAELHVVEKEKLVAHVSALQHEIKEAEGIKERLGETAALAEALESQLVGLKADLEVGNEAKRTLGDTTALAKKLENDLAAASFSITNLQAELAARDTSISELKTEIASGDEAKRDLMSAIEESKHLLEELGSARSEVEKRTRESEKSAEVIRDLRNELKEVSAAMSILEASKTESAVNAMETLKVLEDKLSSEETRFSDMREQYESKNNELQSLVSEMQVELSNERSVRESLKANISNLDHQLKSVLEENESYELKLCAIEADLKHRGDELIQVHEMLESANGKANDLKQQVIDLEDELESKETLLSQSQSAYEHDRDRLTRELEAQKTLVSSLSSQLDSADDGPGADKEAIEAEIMELKQLLASSNEVVKNARESAEDAEARFLLKEEELAECFRELHDLRQKLEEAKTAAPETSALVAQKTELESMIAQREEQHKKSVADLKHLMGVEQREIIRKAEVEMISLRKELSELKVAFEKSETEAYYARQRKEELEDENNVAMKKVAELESRIDFLEAEVKKTTELERWISAIEKERDGIKRELETQGSNRQAEVNSLRSQLENFESQRNALEKKLIATQRSKEKAEQSLSSMTKQQHRYSELELENCHLQEELQKLSKSLGVEAKESNAIVEELSLKIKSKDERIRKLEERKLTREQISIMKKIKSENSQLKNEITNLRKTHSAQPQTNPATENSELAELRFHKEALENKLRKYASHCQNLEDERTGVLHVLRATKIDGINENDLAKTIVTLCDRVSSLEEERDSLSARPSDSAEEIEELKRIKYSLEKDLAVARKEVLKLLSSTSQRDDELARLRQDLDSTRLALEEQAQVSTSSAELELQLKYLEKENLRLMQELKNTKKQLQSARTQAAKINIAESDDTTMDLQALKSRIALEHKPPRSKSHAREDKPPQSKKRALEHTSTPIKGRVVVDKENSGNDVAISAVLPTRPASTAKKARVAGLGESTGETEENTAECTQS